MTIAQQFFFINFRKICTQNSAQSDFFVGFNLHPNKNRKQVLSSSGIY
jgi:hypothetical protein